MNTYAQNNEDDELSTSLEAVMQDLLKHSSSLNENTVTTVLEATGGKDANVIKNLINHIYVINFFQDREK